MARWNRFTEGLTLSLTLGAVGLAGCGGEDHRLDIPVPGSTGGASGITPGTGAAGNAGMVVTPMGAGGFVSPPPTGNGGSVVNPPPPGGSTSVGGTSNGGTTSMGGSGGDPPGGDLVPPPAGDGYQIATPTFALNPGQEVFRCYHAAMQNTAEFDVGKWESQMSPGSHHFILYTADGDTTAAGTLAQAGCTVGFGGPTWLYTSGSPHSQLAFPDGVAMALKPAQRLLFDMHYINTGVDPMQVHVTLNINKVKAAEFQKAQAQVSFNTQIRIPANGMQTVGGDCTPPPNVNYFIMSTHTHKRGVDATITKKLANGMLGDVLVHTTNWDAPAAAVWDKPPFMTFAAGEKFHYSCTFKNDRASVVTVGTSAENNEMCMAITYFFPAASGGMCN